MFIFAFIFFFIVGFFGIKAIGAIRAVLEDAKRAPEPKKSVLDFKW